MQRDSANLGIADATYDRAVLFFLLHEMPEDVRRRTLAEALRVVKPGGELVIVDYHRPSRWHPLRGVMTWILRNFEPFALDLWAHDVERWLPAGVKPRAKETFYGGLYQRLVSTA
jgi:ubiquinone/menaquinone biosynthesis C-methylase UbiE